MGLLSKTAWRVVATWIAIMSGAAGLMLSAFLLYRAAHGVPTPPSDEWAMFGYLTVVVFILSGWTVIRQERSRADAAEQVNRNLRRADEQRSVNVPKGTKVAHLNALIWQARTPDVLDSDSTKLLEAMIDHAIGGLNPDTLFVLRRERFSAIFGPFEGRRGRYRARLSWMDARAEVTRLRQRGMVEPVEGSPGRFRWTPLGLAVIGKLGPQLRWWRAD